MALPPLNLDVAQSGMVQLSQHTGASVGFVSPLASPTLPGTSGGVPTWAIFAGVAAFLAVLGVVIWRTGRRG